MRVVCLGAGTAIPAAGYSPASIYVQAAQEHILLDAGAGSLQRLQRAGLPWHQLDRIFLTHFHLDHCLDLASILFAYRLPQLKRRKPLTVYGPPGLRKLYTQLDRVFQGWLTPRGFNLTLIELQETELRLKGYTVRTKRMNHYATRAVGYRVTEKGTSIAYSGDTDTCDAVVELGRGADLLILECSTPDEKKIEGHLTPSACARIAEAAQCRRLMLTHFYPVFKGYDIRSRVRRLFKGPLILAKDFTSVSL